MKIEICVDTIEAIKRLEKVQDYVDRIELCSCLVQGGLTPSLGMLKIARKIFKKEIYVMIRPRVGDFLYSNEEIEIMRQDIREFKDFCDGFVFGVLTKQGGVDKEKTLELVHLSRPKGVTFHRAFDVSSNLQESLIDLIELKIERVLTSGGENVIQNGITNIENLIKIGKDKIIIMGGSGVNKGIVPKMMEIGIQEIHFSSKIDIRSEMDDLPKISFGNDPYSVDTENIKEIFSIINKN